MARYTYTLRQEISHQGLNKYRVVTAQNRYELNQKIAAIQAQWDEQWQRKCEVEARKQELEARKRDKEQQKRDIEKAVKFAEDMTKDAVDSLEQIENILKIQIKPLEACDMYDKTKFTTSVPDKPIPKTFSREPLRKDSIYNPPMSFFTSISKKKKQAFIDENDEKFNLDYKKWQEECVKISNDNSNAAALYNEEFEKWEKEKNEFLRNKEEFNKGIDELFVSYREGDKDASEIYYAELLERINLPLEFENETKCEYNPDSKMLIVDITLPTIDNLPNLKKVTYVKSSGEYKELYQSEAFMKKMYDKAIYDIVLLTLKAIFDANDPYVEAIVLNGKVNTIEKSTGKAISPYILSVNVSRESFKDLNLEYIDSKEWFKSSKGISAATFTKITPVAPVVEISREDSRFIDGYEVADKLDESVNLAAIDWQDFENLIREIFAEEFNSNGGEVKITQASRDGGVDAIAFDPDPIRGGKIVIQAKRYTNVVGVSAVRDLYGTVMNEGATKGILVTTSNYGNDAYEFAKGKPLTLMNGANLLFLLEKHGHKAKIDLKEAKELNNQNKS